MSKIIEYNYFKKVLDYFTTSYLSNKNYH